MKTTIDARTLACPQPVVLTAKALLNHEQVTTIVDNRVAVENVSRLARAKGFRVAVDEQPDGFHITLSRDGGSPILPSSEEPIELISCQPSEPGKLAIFAASNCLGEGSAELGERLMAAFFHTLKEVPPLPQTIVLMNSGVKLTIEGSRCLEDLKELAGLGVDILVCGTCLGYYELTDRLAAGKVSNMYDIELALFAAGRVLRV